MAGMAISTTMTRLMVEVVKTTMAPRAVCTRPKRKIPSHPSGEEFTMSARKYQGSCGESKSPKPLLSIRIDTYASNIIDAQVATIIQAVAAASPKRRLAAQSTALLAPRRRCWRTVCFASPRRSTSRRSALFLGKRPALPWPGGLTRLNGRGRRQRGIGFQIA